MPEPQPGADRPVDGTTPHRDREPAVTDEPTPVTPAGPTEAAGPRTEASGPAGTAAVPAPGGHPTAVAPADDQPTTPAPASVGDESPAPLPAAGGQPSGPQGTRQFPAGEPSAAQTHAASAGPSGTRKLPAEEAPEPPAPRWSGSAAVPPPPPRKRGWGESAEPTPVPPSPVEAPEDRTPVDPWAGADTGGWELPSAELPELPPLPPTTPYPSPAPTRPYSGPPAPASPAPGHPVSPPAAYPASPAPAAYPPAAYPPVAYPVAPPPAPPLPPAPPARSKRWRRSAPPPVAPPPGWQAPKGYVPVPVRRRRKWPWVLLLTLACCCGCPAYWATPMFSQVPASAALPGEIKDLRLRDDSRSTQAAEELKSEVRNAHWLASDTFAGVYTTQAGKRVTVFGGTGFWFAPESEADAEIARLTEKYALGEPKIFDTGVRGRHERCAVGRDGGTDVVVCTSVDHGSIATGVFTRLSMEDSAALLGTLREQIVTKQG